VSEQNLGILSRLLAELGDTRLVSNRWLWTHGYSNSLVARYVGIHGRALARYNPMPSRCPGRYASHLQ